MKEVDGVSLYRHVLSRELRRCPSVARGKGTLSRLSEQPTHGGLSSRQKAPWQLTECRLEALALAEIGLRDRQSASAPARRQSAYPMM